MKSYFLILSLGFCLVACSKTDTPAAAKESPATPAAAPEGQIKPTITLSRERIPQKGWLKMFGKDLTPVKQQMRLPGMVWGSIAMEAGLGRKRKVSLRFIQLGKVRTAARIGCPF